MGILVMTRYIAISDIHGELAKLESVLSKIETKPDDVFVFMGDYIDRGADSKGVVDRVIAQSDTHECIYLMGSHEYALLHTFDDYYNYLFENFGGPETVKSYGSFENIFKIHGDFYGNLKFWHKTDNYLFVHAGINPDYSFEDQSDVDLVYIRDKFIYSKHDLPQKVIFGHTHFRQPLIQEDKICIDTGCGKFPDAHLTALIIDDEGAMEFVCSD